MAKGYSQKEGENFNELFSLVVEYLELMHVGIPWFIHVLFALVTQSNDLELEQLDSKIEPTCINLKVLRSEAKRIKYVC